MENTAENSLKRWTMRSISRRSMLKAFSTAGVAAPFLPLLPSNLQAAGQNSIGTGVHVSRPIFSVTERNRRWALVRSIMAEPKWNFDAILTTNPGDEAYARYLTQIGGRAGGADVIFPRDSSKTVYALTGASRNRDFWQARLDAWSADGKLVITSEGGPTDVASRLKALGLGSPGTRVGVAKLSGTRFDPEGLVPSTYFEHLQGALPGVSFFTIEDWPPDPGPIDEAAMIKSPEEQSAIKNCVAAGEKAIEAIIRASFPPSHQQADVWFPAFLAMLSDTSEDPDRLSIALDAPANTTLGAPTDDPLNRGQIISQEIEASVQGYSAQVNHSIFVGSSRTPGFEYYKVAMETAIQLFFDALALIRPGITTAGDLADHYSSQADALGAVDASGVVLHSDGIGNLARPRIGPNNTPLDKPTILLPGMTFDFKPAITMQRNVIADVGTTNRVVQIGENVLITQTGAVRLGNRKLEPISTER
jgi:Xaa-Pro aminopeptidase